MNLLFTYTKPIVKLNINEVNKFKLNYINENMHCNITRGLVHPGLVTSILQNALFMYCMNTIRSHTFMNLIGPINCSWEKKKVPAEEWGCFLLNVCRICSNRQSQKHQQISVNKLNISQYWCYIYIYI